MTDYPLPLVVGDTVTVIAPTAPPAPPTPPTPVGASALGMVVTDQNTTLYDAMGNGYALSGPPPAQILLTPPGGTKGIVTSSALVMALMVAGVTTGNPSGIIQFNTGLAVYGVAQTNTAGVYLGTVPGLPIAYLPGAAEPYPTLPAATFKVDDWKSIMNNTARNGSATQWASDIPTPGGGIPYEYSNPERQFYGDPNAGLNPYSMGAGNSLIITAKPGQTPLPSQDYQSGILCSAGSGGVVGAFGYGTLTTRTRMLMDGPGAWPGDWYLPIANNFTYIQGGEYDAMEMWQALPQFHCGIAGFQNSLEPDLGIYPGYKRTDFHNYTTVYSEGNSAFFVDGLMTIKTPTVPAMKDQKLLLLMDLAVGRDNTWAGDPPANGATFKRETSMFHVYPVPTGWN